MNIFSFGDVIVDRLSWACLLFFIFVLCEFPRETAFLGN
jgi:hypothetical protein